MNTVDLASLSRYLGLAGFALWALAERGFSLLEQQQEAAGSRARGSYWAISICWYAAILFAILDAWNYKLTVLPPAWSGLQLAGALLVLAGLVVRFLARRDLGKNYSVQVATSPTHRLVQDGIYKRLRHPAYLGLLGLLLGIPLSEGSLGGLAIAVLGGLPALLLRIRIEEKWLAEWFGEEYAAYRQKTWRLIPYLW